MQVNSVGEYQYNTSDIIGHGAFAIVFKGRSKLVNIIILHSMQQYLIFICLYTIIDLNIQGRHSHCKVLNESIL